MLIAPRRPRAAALFRRRELQWLGTVQASRQLGDSSSCHPTTVPNRTNAACKWGSVHPSTVWMATLYASTTIRMGADSFHPKACRASATSASAMMPLLSTRKARAKLPCASSEIRAVAITQPSPSLNNWSVRVPQFAVKALSDAWLPRSPTSEPSRPLRLARDR